MRMMYGQTLSTRLDCMYRTIVLRYATIITAVVIINATYDSYKVAIHKRWR